jgi:hypothetical protein
VVVAHPARSLVVMQGRLIAPSAGA